MTAQELSEAAFAAFNRGDWPEAEQLFSALLGMVPDWLPCRYGLGMTLFQRENYAGAAPLLRAAFEGAIGLPDSWTYHCHALAILEREAELAAALAHPMDPSVKADLAFQIFNNRLAHGRAATVAPLYAQLPLEPALLMPGAFWAGLASAEENAETAYRYFQAALDEATNLRALGIDHALVKSHIAAGAGIEPDSFVFAPDAPPAQALDSVTWLDPPDFADPALGVFFAAADHAYFEAFAMDCATSLAVLGAGRTLHLHIINPGDDLAEQIEATRAATPGLDLRVSVEIAPTADAVYYACARFLVLPRLIERYRTTITVIDIDCVFQPAAARLPMLADKADVALFRLDTVFPWLKHPAAMVIFADTAAGTEVASLIEHFLRRKLRGSRSWTLDQAALFCVFGAVRRCRPEVIVVELTATTGLVLDDLVRSQGSFAEKRALRLKTISG